MTKEKIELSNRRCNMSLFRPGMFRHCILDMHLIEVRIRIEALHKEFHGKNVFLGVLNKLATSVVVALE